jgi:hypothetical protein
MASKAERRSTLKHPTRRQFAVRTGIAVSILLVLAACRPIAAQQAIPSLQVAQLETLVRQASRRQTSLVAPGTKLAAAQALFARTLRAQEPVELLQQAWATLSFELEVYQSNGGQVWLVRESADHQAGRGFYAFRPEQAIPIALQAPHSFADKDTRRLATQLFLSERFRAAAWNTVHRKTIDLAHTDASFFNAFTCAFVDVYREQAIVCQLHGFARAKRTTAAGRSADLILSDGSRSPPYWLHVAAKEIRALSPQLVVRLYPVEVSELGATTNRQGRALREAGVGKFLHLEMSPELRLHLIESPQARADYLKIFVNIGRSDKVIAG